MTAVANHIPVPDTHAVTELPEHEFPGKFDKLGAGRGLEPVTITQGSGLPPVNRLTPPKMDYSGPNHRTLNPFFARHNPHPHNVHHIKGLLDLPICMVENLDSARPATSAGIGIRKFPPNHFVQSRIKERRQHSSSRPGQPQAQPQLTNKMPVTAINLVGPRSRLIPNDTINGLQYFTGLQNYSFKDRAQAADAGMSTDAQPWRHELAQLTDAAFLPVVAAQLEQQRQANQQDSGLLRHPGEWLMTDENKAGAGRSPGSSARQLYSASSGRLIVSANQKRPCPHTASVTGSQTARPTESRSGWLTPKLSTNAQALPVRHSSQSRDAEARRSDRFNPLDQANQIKEIQVFQMLCGILQTQDEKSVQTWLLNASDREKNLVIDILQSALKNRDEYYNLHGDESLQELPQTAISQNNLDPIHEIDPQQANGQVDRLVVHGEENGATAQNIPSNVYNSADAITKKSGESGSDGVRPPTSSMFRPTSSTAMKSANQNASRPATSGKSQIWSQNDSLAK